MIWYEEEVKTLEKKIAECPFRPETVFYGSSSIRLWETLTADFEVYKPINLGFGGSTLAACDWFFDRLPGRLQPRRIVFYAGDNDLGDGRHSEEVFIFLQQLMARISQQFGNIPFAYIAIKPSIARWSINDKIRYTNQLICDELKKYPNAQYIDIYTPMLTPNGTPNPEFFNADGLHLSAKGYALWKNSVLNYLQKL
jgi:lysophospholipase L1-like esterase